MVRDTTSVDSAGSAKAVDLSHHCASAHLLSLAQRMLRRFVKGCVFFMHRRFVNIAAVVLALIPTPAGAPLPTTRKANGQFLATTFGFRF